MNQLFRKISLVMAVSCLALGAFAQTKGKSKAQNQPQGQMFVIKGNIQGVKNGTKVSLRSKENGKNIEAKCLSQGSSFVLKGRVVGTLLVELNIDDKPQAAYKQDEYAEARGGNFLLEGGNYTVSAACYDSIPLVYDLYSVPMVHEKNLKIVGGKAQLQYQEWADATFDVRLKAKLLDHQLRQLKYPDDRKAALDTAAINRLEPQVDEAFKKADEADDQFIAAHPDYAISLLLEKQIVANPFAMTAAEYDKALDTFAANYDKQRYAEFQKTVAEMKKYPKGAPYRDLALETVDGKPIQLKEVIQPGKYNFIDFWASWCGPCRAAIPSVKKMYAKMGDKLNIISVSVDKQRKSWEKAMEEEKMPWRQLILPQTSSKALTEGYQVEFIPSLVVIDPAGNIQLFTGDPSEAHQYLEERVK